MYIIPVALYIYYLLFLVIDMGYFHIFLINTHVYMFTYF